MIEKAAVKITQDGIILNDDKITFTTPYSLSDIYKEYVGGYPKFHKMDGLSKLGFLASEFLLKDMTADEKEHIAIALFNRSSSLVTDRNYQNTISDPSNFYPSPALFVYTLANIVTGEIAIRHKIYGETAFYILNKEESNTADTIIESMFCATDAPAILTGWLEYDSEKNFYANFRLLSRQ